MEEGWAQRSGAEGSSGLASLCLPLLSLPCQAANEVTRPPRLPWAHRVATCHSPWERARETGGPPLDSAGHPLPSPPHRPWLGPQGALGVGGPCS